MTNHQPITPAELAALKTFWSAEDERNGGISDTSRCIAEIERLHEKCERMYRKGFQHIADDETPACPDLTMGNIPFDDFSKVMDQVTSSQTDENGHPL